ncbi:MAG: MBL fold metallo-hydrolase [Candidatus Neomarinimicrobiota bacterium]
MEVKIKWIGGATFILTIDNLKIACDPDLSPKDTIQDYFWFKSRRLDDPVYATDDFNNVDLWLITHEHEDHLNPLGIEQISPTAIVVANRAAARILRKTGHSKVTTLRHGRILEYRLAGCDIRIRAIKAVHGVNPLAARLAGRGNGYLVTVLRNSELANIYITGDTVYDKRITRSLHGTTIDVLIPNLGAVQKGSWIGMLTLDAAMLRKFIADLDPRFVMPVHYGSFSHYKEPISRLTEMALSRVYLAVPGGQQVFPIGD